VASDQNTSTIEPDLDQVEPVIPNQLPAYRAISVQAVLSLFFGILAIFSFAHPFFYLFSVVAIVMGILANRAIQRYPDMLTGTGLAKTGITLGLIFGLVSGTYTGVQTFVRTRAAEGFARKYTELLKAPSEGDVLWYSLHPQQRKDKTSAQVLQEFESAKTKDRMMAEQKTGPLKALRKRLASSKDQELRFVKIRNVGEDDSRGGETTIYAVAIFEVEGPVSKEFPQEHQHVATVLKGMSKGRHYDWWVDDLKFPFNDEEITPTSAKPADDGHGHAH
jgi:Domain of unknown function (DUF4190)